MKPIFPAALAALCVAASLAACAEPPIRNDREQTLDVEISAPAEPSAAPTESTYDPQQTMLSSAILDLYYYQLDAIKAGDAADFLATYPPAYAERTYPTKEALAEYEESFEKKAAAWIADMGESVRLTLTVVDETPTTPDDAKAYTDLLAEQYGMQVTVQDTRRFTFKYTLTGEPYEYHYDPITATAIKVDDNWYLPPGTTLFWF